MKICVGEYVRLDEKILKVGVVGLGKMGLLHACIANVMPSVVLSGLCEKSKTTRKLISKVLSKVSVVDDVTSFEDLGLDVIFVTTPVSSHFGVARVILEEALAPNIFVEKPLASKYSESKELHRLSSRNGANANMVGYIRRHMVTFRKAKELFDQCKDERRTLQIIAFSKKN